MATMHGMPSQLDLYEEMRLLSSRMVEAARAGDWEDLIGLERDVTRLRNTLMATPESNNATVADQTRKRNLIQCILEDDAEVRRHTEPWMERMRKYLGDGTRRHDVQQANALRSGKSTRGGYGA